MLSENNITPYAVWKQCPLNGHRPTKIRDTNVNIAPTKKYLKIMSINVYIYTHGEASKNI